MRHTTTVRETFEAAHRIPDSRMCRDGHGHRWTVEVTVAGTLDPKKVFVVDHGDLLAALGSIISEFALRDLDDMLPGVRSTPEGLAMYIRERLALNWPGIVRVNVGMGDSVSVGVEWDVR